MIVNLKNNKKSFRTDLSDGIDLSVPLQEKNGLTGWGQPPVCIEPLKNGEQTFKVKAGAAVNFNRICFSPHAHGTHTEGVGHISPVAASVNKSLGRFFYLAQLVTVNIEEIDGEEWITKAALRRILGSKIPEALIIRTRKTPYPPNFDTTNWPALTQEAAVFLNQSHIQHLLIDTPSVDKKNDGGKLRAHKGFWFAGENTRTRATITELIQIPPEIPDALYLLNLQVAAIENNAAPSRPVIFELQEI